MTWDQAMTHSFEVAYPSFLWVIITAIIFVLWLFGTDMYDFLNDSDSDEHSILKFFGGGSVVCIFNAIVGYMFTWVNPLNWVLNGFLTFCLILMFGALILDSSAKFRAYCQRKRGKKK